MVCSSYLSSSCVRSIVQIHRQGQYGCISVPIIAMLDTYIGAIKMKPIPKFVFQICTICTYYRLMCPEEFLWRCYQTCRWALDQLQISRIPLRRLSTDPHATGETVKNETDEQWFRVGTNWPSSIENLTLRILPSLDNQCSAVQCRTRVRLHVIKLVRN